MKDWHWLTHAPGTRGFVIRVLAKAAAVFIIFNVLFALLDPLDPIGRITIYNGLVPGRVRLPYGEDARAYNLSLDNLNAMFASHVVAQPKATDEFRVVFIGDSSIWGILLKPDKTITGVINNSGETLENGQRIHAYNLGHPVLSIAKDLLILDHAVQYEPDMVIWLSTLRSFRRDEQLSAPIVQNNTTAIRRLFSAHNLDYDLTAGQLADPSFLDRTIVGQRRALADWLRLQFYGVMWASTGIDQYYPDRFDPVTSDFEDDASWNNLTSPQPLTESNLALDILRAGQEMAGDTPLIVVNEPIFISSGANSALRYNLWYPRWAYDEYRQILASMAEAHGWQYADLWNMIDSSAFTDSPVHLTPAGSRQLAARLADVIVSATEQDH